MNSNVVTIVSSNAASKQTINLPSTISDKSTVTLVNADIDLTRLLSVPRFSFVYDTTHRNFENSNFVSGKEFFESNIPSNVLHSASYSDVTHLITLNIEPNHTIICDDVLMAITGLPAICLNTTTGFANVSHFLNYIYVLTNVVDMQFYNSNRLPLIGVFPIRPGDDTLEVRFGQCFPIKLSTPHVKQFNIWFTNEKLQPLTFADGITSAMVQLEFK